LALLCVVGMFSIPLGENIKVSLQLLMVMIICLISDSVFDCLIITGCYLGLGMFLPIYAGFRSGVSATFGYVIAFVAASPVYYFLNKLPKIPAIARMIIACIAGTLVVYAIGTLWMMFYLNWDLATTLLTSVVPYLPFDGIKIALAIAIVLALPKFISNRE
nr:biotin transporter BioY [Bacilli bacterium]